MQIIHRQHYFPGHAQVAILDSESGSNYPVWKIISNQQVVANEHGIAVATAPTFGDLFVEVVVAIENNAVIGDIHCITHTILVGKSGLDVGDPVADYSNIAWNEGELTISVYCNNNNPNEVTKVLFVLHPQTIL